MRSADAIHGYIKRYEYDDTYAKPVSRKCELESNAFSSLKNNRIKRKITMAVVIAAMLGIFGSICFFQLGFAFLIPEAKYPKETILSVEYIASLAAEVEICQDAVADVNKKYRWGASTTNLRPFSDCINYVSSSLKCASDNPSDKCSSLGESIIRIEEAGGK